MHHSLLVNYDITNTSFPEYSLAINLLDSSLKLRLNTLNEAVKVN